MEEFFMSIENHKGAAFCTALFAIICMVFISDWISELRKK